VRWGEERRGENHNLNIAVRPSEFIGYGEGRSQPEMAGDRGGTVNRSRYFDRGHVQV
jgi:hypothetical protein